MDERAVVVDVLANGVVVESQLKSTCSGCQQVDNCGSGQVAKAFPQPKLTVEIATNDSYQVGDEVLISVPEQTLLSVAWQVYLWPLIGLALAAALGQHFMLAGVFGNTLAELPVILLALVGGFAGFKLAKYRLATSSLHQQLTPTIKGRVLESVVAD